MASVRINPILFLVAAVVAVLLPFAAMAVPTPVDVYVNAASGDAEESELGAIGLSEPILDLGGIGRRVGMRFAGVNVPRNASITAAYIQFTSAASDSTAAGFTIEAEASDNPAAFAATVRDITDRLVYFDNVSWTPANWTAVDQTHNSADIKAIVQKLVNRPGWNANNAMAFILTSGSDNTRRAKSYDSSPSMAPKLHIEWDGNAIEVRVNASTDDGYQYSTSTTYMTSSSVNIASASSSYCSGLRFQNVNLPEGATITNAYISMRAQSNAVAGSSTKTITIWGEKRLSPPTFSTLTSSADAIGYRKGLNQTAQKTYWSTIPAWTQYLNYQTSDIKAVVQEIVGQAGWGASNKAMVFFMNSSTEARSVTSWNGGSTVAPLLHIDYLMPAAGESGSPVMAIPSDFSNISRTCSQGETALSRYFELLNTGSATLNYNVATTYSAGSNWLSLSPSAASGTLGPGIERHFTLGFNSSGLAAGTYHATVNFTSTNFPAPSPASQSVEVFLTVNAAPQVQSCDDIPVYLRETSSPAVMILLDLSQSMNDKVYTLPEGYQYPRTPDLKTIVSEIVRYAGWQSGNALTVFLERSSGTGKRHAWAYDGYSGWAPLLHIEYSEPDNNLPRTLDIRVSQSTDDGGPQSGSLWNTGWQSLELGASGLNLGVAMRFPNVTIPYNATITSAYIEMVPSLTETGSLNLLIRGHQSTNSGALTDMIPMSRPKTAASVNWAAEAWTGIVAQSKMEIAKQVISTLVASEPAISWGFGTWAQFDPYPEAIPAVVPSEAERTYTRVQVGCAPYSAAQVSRLQTAISNTNHQSGSDTPFAPSFLGAKKYFAGQKADADGVFFQGTGCQPKVLINITDGRGNVPVDVAGDAYVGLVETRARDLIASGVSVVGVGFGMGPEGDIRAQLQKAAEVANAEGQTGASDMIFPLHQEDDDGTGVPYFAQDQSGLAEALQIIASGVKNAVFYGSAPAAFSHTDLGDTVLVSSYRTTDWTGDLQAITRDESGQWKNQLWRASEKVPANRTVWTVIDSGAVVPYSNYNFFCKPIGDIINSAPVVVGPPPFFYHFDNYRTFVWDKTQGSPRETMVYYGSNDGLIHAVSLATGIEKWAFLPYGVHMQLISAPNFAIYDRCSPDYCHKYLLDAPPRVGDVYDYFGLANKQWRTILVIGQRAGGDAYTALDVTAGESFDHTPPYNAKYLWEFTDPDLGQTWSEPQIERVQTVDASCYQTGNAWGVFFGSGYALDPAQQPTKEAYVYAVKADDGSPLWRNNLGNPVSKFKLLASGYRPNNAASSPLVADLLSVSYDWANFPGACQRQRIYVGDLYGTIYRLTGIGPQEAPHETRLFQFASVPATPDVNPVRGKPTYAYSPQNTHIWVYYGTGRFENEGDKTNAAQQYFFGLKDAKNPPLGFNNTAPTYTLSNLVQLQANLSQLTLNGASTTIRTITGTNANADSWYMKLHKPASGGSERVFTKPLAVGGVVFFTTFIPDADACSGSGDTYLFALDYQTGLPPSYPVLDINGDLKVNNADKVVINGNPAVVPAGIHIGRGQGSAPVIFKNTIFITTTVAQYGTSGTESGNPGGLHSILVNLPNYKVRTESWKHD